MTAITLFIPGLLSPARDLLKSDMPTTPALKKLLSVGKRQTFHPASFSRKLYQLFGFQETAEQDDPVAAVTHLIDDQATDNGLWMRADPVHLAADRNGVVLMDESCFDLELQEALVLAADIRGLLSEYGLELIVPTTHRWYLKLSEPPGVITTPIHEVVAKDIHRFMPTGAQKDRWARLMNEIQMTLHNSRINETRQQQGKLPINSIWCWGSGTLPAIKTSNWDGVYSDELIGRGLAQLAGIGGAELPEDADELIKTGGDADHLLVILSFGLRHWQYHDLKGWQDFMAYLEAFWFTKLLTALRQGTLSELTLVLEDQEIHITKLSLIKFWKQQKQLQAYLT